MTCVFFAISWERPLRIHTGAAAHLCAKKKKKRFSACFYVSIASPLGVFLQNTSRFFAVNCLRACFFSKNIAWSRGSFGGQKTQLWCSIDNFHSDCATAAGSFTAHCALWPLFVLLFIENVGFPSGSPHAQKITEHVIFCKKMALPRVNLAQTLYFFICLW